MTASEREPFDLWPAIGADLDAITVCDDHPEDTDLWLVIDTRDRTVVDTLGRAEARDLCDGLNRLYSERGERRRIKAN